MKEQFSTINKNILDSFTMKLNFFAYFFLFFTTNFVAAEPPLRPIYPHDIVIHPEQEEAQPHIIIAQPEPDEAHFVVAQPEPDEAHIVALAEEVDAALLGILAEVLDIQRLTNFPLPGVRQRLNRVRIDCNAFRSPARNTH